MISSRVLVLMASFGAAFVSGCGSDVETQQASGTSLWARRVGRASSADTVGLAAVPGGGVIAVGRYFGAAEFGGAPLASPGNNYQVFVAKYDTEGNHVYSHGFGQEAAEWATDVASLPDGSALVLGNFSWKVDFGTGELFSAGNDDIFVVKLGPDGAVKWAKRYGGTGFQMGYSIAAMPDGGAAISGLTSGPVDFAEGEPQDGSSYGFVMRLDPAGDPAWAKVFATSNYQTVVDVAARPDGSLVVGGSFYDTIDLGGPKPLVAAQNSQDGFVAAYDASGKWLWERGVGGDGYSDVVNAIAVRPDGGVLMTGQVEGTVDFGGAPLFGIEFDANTFLLELDAAGKHVKSAIYGRQGYDAGNDIALGADGSVVLTGNADGGISFGRGVMTSRGGLDAFVAKIDPSGEARFQVMYGDTGSEIGERIVVESSGRVVVAGAVQAAVDFGFGPTSGSGYYETFLVGLAP